MDKRTIKMFPAQSHQPGRTAAYMRGANALLLALAVVIIIATAVLLTAKVTGDAFDILNLLTLLLCMLLALFLYAVGRNILMNRFFFTPLCNLNKSVLRSMSDGGDIFGIGRDDKIGELARTIQGLRDSLNANIAEMRQARDEQDRRDILLNTMNHMAGILLRSGINDFEANLQSCMGMIAGALDIDRVYIWKNSLEEEEKFFCTQAYEWSCIPEANQNTALPKTLSYADTIPRWESILSRGECICGLVSDLPVGEQDLLASWGVLSVFVIPIFPMGRFWGFIRFDDCHNNRVFPENILSLLRSGGIMMTSALFRHEMMVDLKAAADELKSALDRANDASRAKSHFLANTSHEMRTPLNAIIGLSQLTLEAGGIHKDALANLEKIYNAGTTLLSTVNDILDISKIEAGKLELVPIDYDVLSLIFDTANQCVMRIGDKPIRFTLNIDENLPIRLLGDDLRIKQIINNLLSNAFKYTREGEVVLGIRSRQDGEIVWLEITVRDTGIGIKKEDMETLFFNYTQMDVKINHKVEGTGLGLPIAKRLAEMMDGSITVSSEYGKGSVFLARIQQEAVTDVVIGPNMAKNLNDFSYADYKRAQNLSISRIRLDYARVLVVDDVLTNLEVAKGLLGMYGMKIDCVTNGQDAIAAIRSEKVRYNAIFMDHMMPGLDGIETAEEIRTINTDYAKNIPIIVMTANAIVGNEEMFLKKGFQAFISKPIDTVRLDTVVREWVRDPQKEDEINNMQAVMEEDNARISDRHDVSDKRNFRHTIPGLNMRRGIKHFGGNEETYLSVLRTYAKETRSLLDTIKEVRAETLNNYAITVHGIKGSSRGIFATVVGTRAEDLEKAAKAGDIGFVKAHNPAFLEVTKKLVTGIEEALSKETAKKSLQKKKEKPDNETLSRLLLACTKYDIDEIDMAMDEIESCEYSADGNVALWLRENVDRMNYKQVAEKIEEMIHG